MSPIYTYTGQLGTAGMKCGAWRAFYSDGSGVFAEVALGAAGEVYQSGGPAAPPVFGLLTNANIDAAAAIAWTKLADASSSGLMVASAGNPPAVLADVTAGRFLVSAGVASDPYYPAGADLFWDNTNKRLGVGNAAPSVALDVSGRIVASTSMRAPLVQVRGAAPGLYFEEAGGGTWGYFVMDTATKVWTLYGQTSTLDRMTIDDVAGTTVLRTTLETTGALTTGAVTWPAVDGTVGQVPTTDGAGTVTFGKPWTTGDVTMDLILWPFGKAPTAGDILVLAGPIEYNGDVGSMHIDYTHDYSVTGLAPADFGAGNTYPDDYVLYWAITANGANWDFSVYRDAARTELLSAALNVAAAGLVTTVPEAGSTLVVSFTWSAGQPADPGVGTMGVVPEGVIIPLDGNYDNVSGAFCVLQDAGASKGDTVTVMFKGECDVNLDATSPSVHYGQSIYARVGASCLEATADIDDANYVAGIAMALESAAPGAAVHCYLPGVVGWMSP
jgi:hypothetical protein